MLNVILIPYLFAINMRLKGLCEQLRLTCDLQIQDINCEYRYLGGGGIHGYMLLT
jgi:hypothetical protein